MVVKQASLDSNALSAFLGGIPSVRKLTLKVDILYLPAIVYGEQIYGYSNGNRYEKNLDLLTSFINKPKVVFAPITERTSFLYGHLKTALSKAGTPLPDNDIWIAAHTQEVGSILITNDNHFDYVKEIQTWKFT